MNNRASLATPTRKAILINGLPATGKTSLGEFLRDRFEAPLLTLDTIKEAMFDELGTGDREYNRMLGRATKQIIWAVISEFPHDSLAIVDAWFGFPPYDKVFEGLKHAGVARFVELWCHAPGEILARRYLERVDHRHKGHPGREYAPELEEVARRAAPMNIGPLYAIDMSDFSTLDYESIAKWVAKELDLPVC
jgi:glucokinase